MQYDELYGRELGEYVLRERLGGGAFGRVYRCDQDRIGHEVVVKVLHPHQRDNAALTRLKREAQIAARLDHPYAIRVHDVGSQDGFIWLVMERVDGVTLERWLRETGPMSLEQYVPFAQRVAEVLQTAHELGIVHRDIKPSNIMIVERAGELLPKLLDFGIARLLHGDGHDDDNEVAYADGDEATWLSGEVAIFDPEARDNTGTTARPPHRSGSCRSARPTEVNAASGTPAYLAPEQWRRSPSAGAAADIYAFGVVSYEALTGRKPFSAPTLRRMADLHRLAAVPPLGAGFPPGLDAVMRRALAKRPEDRYRTPLELVAALHAELRPRERLERAAQQWHEQDRSRKLLMRATEFAAEDLERWKRRGSSSELVRVYVASSERAWRRTAWVKSARAVAAIVVVAAGIAGWQAVKAHDAKETVTALKADEGRIALISKQPAEALRLLAQAFERGDHSRATLFMYARALQPRAAEQSRVSAISGRMWSAIYSPGGHRILTADDGGVQVWDVQTNVRLLVLRQNDVHQALYSRDGRQIFAACGDGAVRIWDAATGARVRELRPNGRLPNYSIMALSPDGSSVAAVAFTPGMVDVWDTSTGAPLAELAEPHNEGASYPSIGFSPDGRWLAASSGGALRVFRTGRWMEAIALPDLHVRAFSWDPSGARLVTGSADGDISIWDIPGGQRRHLRDTGSAVGAVAFAPDGQLLASGGSDGTAQIWETSSGALLGQLDALRGKVRSLEFDASSELLVVSANCAVMVADAIARMPLAVLDGPADIVNVAHFDPESRQIVGASWDGTARIWDARPPYRRWSSRPVANECGAATSLVPDARYVAVLCADHPTRVWDTARDELLGELPPVTPAPGDFAGAFPAVSADGELGAIARGNTVELYALPGARLMRVIRHSAAVNTVAFAPASHEMISGAVDGSLLLTRDRAEPLALPAVLDGVDAATILADGRIVAAGVRGGLHVYSIGTSGAVLELAALHLKFRVGLLRPSPDGRRLVAIHGATIPSQVGRSVPVVLLDLERYRAISTLNENARRTFTARWLDGAIVTAESDGAARIWDADTGRLRKTFRGNQQFIADVALSPDGSMLVAGGADGLLQFWDVESGNLIWTIQAHRSHVVGVQFDGESILTRGFGGDLARWTLPPAMGVISRCSGCGIADADSAMMAP